MLVQSKSGPAGNGLASNAPAGTQEPSPPPTPPPRVTPPEESEATARAQSKPDSAPEQVVVSQAAERREVTPRARLNYDQERSEVFVEVLNPSNGDVLFSFPAKETDQARLSGLEQGALVDQYV